MKRVDMGLVDLIHSGTPWPYEQPPCSRGMIKHLERNEEVISWVQVSQKHAHLEKPEERGENLFFCVSAAQVGDSARPIPSDQDGQPVLHDESAHDEGRLVSRARAHGPTHRLTLHRAQAKHQAPQGVREPREGTLRRDEAPHPDPPVHRENADAVALQRE